MLPQSHTAKASKRSFARSFLRGLSAPALVYSRHTPNHLPDVAMIEPPNYPISRAMASDWARIGADISKVVGAHVKATR